MSEERAQDLDRIVHLEVSVRNLSATWSSAYEVAERLGGTRSKFMEPARRLAYLMKGCEPTELVAALTDLRSALEEGL